MLHVSADCEDRFPTCDRVSADDGVDGREFFADVVGGPARGGVEFEVSVFGSLVELGLRVGGG